MATSSFALRQLARTLSRKSTLATFPRSFSTVVPGVGKGKTSTGIVGLPVDLDAIPKIISKNQALLDRIEASDMPTSAAYRIDIEAIAKYRIKVCEENPDDPEKVEELIQMGQVEELVEQADDEMAVLEMYLDRRMWEHIKPAEVEYDPGRDDRSDDGSDEESK